MTNILALVLAIALQEGNGRIDQKSVGKAGEVGALQIQQIMLDDHYRTTGVRYTKTQARSWEVSVCVVTNYLAYYGKGKWTPEQCAIAWNAGPDLKPRAAEYLEGFKRHYKWVTSFPKLEDAYAEAIKRSKPKVPKKRKTTL